MSKRREVVLDAAVAAVLGEAERRAGQRGMSRQERRRNSKRRVRKSVTYELDAGIVGLVGEIAEALGVPPAGVAGRLLMEGLERWGAGEIGFEGFLVPSKSPRWEWIVELGDLGGVAAMVARRLAQGEGEV